MTGEQLLRQVELVRAITLTAFDGVTESDADVQPKGFPNTIRWNLGHILIVQEQLAIHFARMQPRLPEHFLKLFGNKTRPSDWTIEPPSLAELKERLFAQTGYVCGELGHRLEKQAVKPFVRLGREMATIGEILNFSLHHEGLHYGAIGGLKKAIEASR